MRTNSIVSALIVCVVLFLLLPMWAAASVYDSDPRPCSRQSRPNQCDRLFHQGRAAAQFGPLENGRARWGYIDRSGAVVIEPRFAYVMPFSGGLAAVKARGDWGYINLSGDWVLPPQYEDATPFNKHGTALVENEDSYIQLIDRSGNVKKTFPLGTRLGYGNFGNRSNFASLEVPIAPVVWRIRDGSSRDLPESVMKTGQPAYGWLPAVKRTSQYGGNWGYLDANMEWVVRPQALQPMRYEPVTDGRLVRIQRDNAFWLVDQQGHILVENARQIELLMPDVWMVQSEANDIRLVDDHGEVIARLGSDDDPDIMDRLGGTRLAGVVITEKKIALVGNDGKVRAYDMSNAYVTVAGHYLIVLEGEYNGRLLQVFDAWGNPVFDQATIKRFSNGYNFFAFLGDHPAPADAKVFVAQMSAEDYKQPDYLLTSTGDVIEAKVWGNADSSHSMAPVVVVETKDDKFGVLDTSGSWIVKPEYEHISSFYNGIAIARTRAGIEVLDMQGNVHELPEAVRKNPEQWLGDILVYGQRNADGFVRYGLWSLRENRLLHEPDITRITDFENGHALARIGDIWGDIDRTGHWQAIPGLKQAYDAERLGDFYSIETSADGHDEYALFSIRSGTMIATGLRSTPIVVNSQRFIVAPQSGGTMLIDGEGNPLAQLQRSVDDVVIGGGFIVLKTDHRYGAIDAMGDWVVPPTLSSEASVRRVLRRSGKTDQPSAEKTASNWIKFKVEDTWTYGFKNGAGDKVIGARFDRLGSMINGRAQAMMIKRYGEMWGYIDRNGRFVIPPRYDFAFPFYKQLAFVGRDNVRAYIDPQGNAIARFVERCGFIVALDENGEQQWPDKPVNCTDSTAH